MHVAATISLDQAAGRRWGAVVVGAGPAGAMAALELARRGVSVLLADKAAFPRWKACGCCLNAWGQATLAQAGLGALAEELGAIPLTHLVLAARGRRATLHLPRPSVAFSREALDSALVRAAIDAGAHFLSETTARLGPAEPDARCVILAQGDRFAEARAGIVLAADGLAGRLVATDSVGHLTINPHSHLGAGVTFNEDPGCNMPNRPYGSYGPHAIIMACGREGYVGLVRVEDGRVNAGAALDPTAVKRRGGIGPVAAAILEDAGLPPIPGFAEQTWKGTPLLTRRLAAPAGERWLALGDAAGYVEPFTGEGMAWALAQGRAIAPIAAEAAQGWLACHGQAWVGLYERLMQGRQRRCRAVAGMLRHPRLVGVALGVLALFPAIASPFVRRFTSERGAGEISETDHPARQAAPR